MEENAIKQKIENLIRSKSFELNLRGTIHKKYEFENVSVLNLISGDFSNGNYKFEGVSKIGVPNINGDLLYDCYNISGTVSVKEEVISMVEPINILKK